MLLNACAPLIIFQSSCVIRIPLPAPSLSAETCFYSQHGSCVVLAGLCGGEGWRGHGGRLRQARRAAAVAIGGAGSLTMGGGLCRPHGCSELAPDLQQLSQSSSEPHTLAPHTDSIFPKWRRQPLGGRLCHSRDAQGKLRQI